MKKTIVLSNRVFFDRGFSIIELLIVTVMAGIVSAVSVAAYSGISTRALNTSIAKNINDYKRLLTTYASENKRYPTTEWVCLGDSPSCFGILDQDQQAQNTFKNELLRLTGTYPANTNRCIELWDVCEYSGTYINRPDWKIDGKKHADYLFFLQKSTNECPQGSLYGYETFSTTGEKRYSKIDTTNSTVLCALALPKPSSL